MHEHLTSSLRGVPDSSAGMLLMSRLNSIQSGMPGRRDRGEGKVKLGNLTWRVAQQDYIVNTTEFF